MGGTGEDTGACRIKFRQGALAQFTISDGDVSMAACAWQFDLYGTKGMLRWPDAVLLPKHPECFQNWRPNRKPVKPVQLVKKNGRSKPPLVLDLIYSHLIKVIEGRTESRLSATEGLKSLELTLAAVDSARAGGTSVTL